MSKKKPFEIIVKQLDGSFMLFIIGKLYRNKNTGETYKLLKIETYDTEVGGHFCTLGRGSVGFWKDVSWNFHLDYEEVK